MASWMAMACGYSMALVPVLRSRTHELAGFFAADEPVERAGDVEVGVDDDAFHVFGDDLEPGFIEGFGPCLADSFGERGFDEFFAGVDEFGETVDGGSGVR